MQLSSQSLSSSSWHCSFTPQPVVLQSCGGVDGGVVTVVVVLSDAVEVLAEVEVSLVDVVSVVVVDEVVVDTVVVRSAH